MDINKKKEIGRELQKLYVQKVSGINTTNSSNLVNTDTLQEILSPNFLDTQIYSLAEKYLVPDGSHGIKIPILKTTTANSNVTAQWVNEEGTITNQAHNFDILDFSNLGKLVISIPVTGELMNDQVSLQTFINKEAVRIINNKVSQEMIYGTGALVGCNQDAYESAQTGTMNIMADLLKHYYGAPNGRYYVGTTAWADIITNYTTVASADAMLTMEDGKLYYGPYEIVWQNNQVMANPSDIVLGDFTQYVIAQKDLRKDFSEHLYFDTDQYCFRTVLRIAGEAKWQPYTDAFSTNVDYYAFCVSGTTEGNNSSSSSSSSVDSSSSSSSVDSSSSSVDSSSSSS